MIVHDSWWSNGSARSTIIDYHRLSWAVWPGLNNNFWFFRPWLRTPAKMSCRTVPDCVSTRKKSNDTLYFQFTVFHAKCLLFQDVVAVHTEDNRSEMICLGHVNHRLICTPDFEQLLSTSWHQGSNHVRWWRISTNVVMDRLLKNSLHRTIMGTLERTLLEFNVLQGYQASHDTRDKNRYCY